ncbi:MAG: methyltransferase family protein [Candidatus Thorarchaeota archaeon]
MDFIPKFGIGWLNGWLPLIIYVSIQFIVTFTCPKEVKRRLIDRKGWTKTQITMTTIGKSFTLINIILLFLSPLKFGSIEFYIGIILYFIGIIALSTAIINFRNAPLGKPIVSGFYRISRNPQLFSIYIIFIGHILMIGSWISLIILLVSILGSHFSILGEEKRLKEQYGNSYLEYKEKVPRYFIFF